MLVVDVVNGVLPTPCRSGEVQVVVGREEVPSVKIGVGSLNSRFCPWNIPSRWSGCICEVVNLGLLVLPGLHCGDAKQNLSSVELLLLLCSEVVFSLYRGKVD